MGRQVSAAFACAIGLVAALLGGGCSSSSSLAPGCKLDADCAAGQVCITGVCQGGGGGSGGGGSANDGAGTSSNAAGTSSSNMAGASNDAAGAPDDAGTDAGTAACLGHVAEPTAAQHCVCQDDCDPGDICADEASTGLPGGICLSACKQMACATGDVCVELTPNDPTTSTCMLACKTSTECPMGQICQNATVNGPLFCFPLCQSDADCPTLGKCNPYTGVCGGPDPTAGPGDIDDPCASDDDCQSSFCVPPSPTVAPGGLCTAFCALSHDGCPAGSACTANWSSVGDEGICFKTCTLDTDCRTSYKCVSFAGTPGKVCAPKP